MGWWIGMEVGGLGWMLVGRNGGRWVRLGDGR